MSGRYQLIVGTPWNSADEFDLIRQAALNNIAGQPKGSTYMWFVRDTETGALYDLALGDVPEPDSRRADLVDHAKDTLLWPYRGLGDE